MGKLTEDKTIQLLIERLKDPGKEKKDSLESCI